METAQILTAVLAPVFFISGIGALTNTMSTRYARVIDRTQVRLAQLTAAASPAASEPLVWEIKVLYGRARLLRAMIILMIGSIFFAMLTVVLLFAKMRWQAEVGDTAEAFFLAALATTTTALALFIRDFAVSLQTLKAEVRRGLAAAGA